MAQFSANGYRYDAYKNFKFQLIWDGRTVAGVSAATVTVAAISYYLIELPIRRAFTRPAGTHASLVGWGRLAPLAVPVTIALLLAIAGLVVTRPEVWRPERMSWGRPSSPGPALTAAPTMISPTVASRLAPIARPGRRTRSLRSPTGRCRDAASPGFPTSSTSERRTPTTPDVISGTPAGGALSPRTIRTSRSFCSIAGS